MDGKIVKKSVFETNPFAVINIGNYCIPLYVENERILWSRVEFRILWSSFEFRILPSQSR